MIRSGIAWGLLSAATFATSGSFATSLFDAGWSPAAAVTIRIGVAALALAGPAMWTMRGRWRELRTNFGLIALYGVFAIACAQVCFFNAVRYLPVGVALLLEYLGLVLVVAWMWAVHGQRPRWLTVLGSVLAIAGLFCVLDLTGNARSSRPASCGVSVPRSVWRSTTSYRRVARADYPGSSWPAAAWLSVSRC